MNKPTPPKILRLKESQGRKIISERDHGNRKAYQAAVHALLLLLVPALIIAMFIALGYSTGFDRRAFALIAIFSALLMFAVGYIFKAMMFKIQGRLDRRGNLEITFVQQGAARIEYGAIEYCNDRIAAILVDLASKDCEVLANSIHDQMPSVVLTAILEPSYPEHTEIAFPQFEGFTVYASEISESALRICLLKKG